MNITAFELAQRFVGTHETAGAAMTPSILAMLKLDADWPENDEVPWCSAFVNWIAWLLRLPRSKSLMARSWLSVGRPVVLTDAQVGFDIVILSRGEDRTSGHVGFFAGLDTERSLVYILGGNQGDAVSVAAFPIARVLGVRSLLG